MSLQGSFDDMKVAVTVDPPKLPCDLDHVAGRPAQRRLAVAQRLTLAWQIQEGALERATGFEPVALCLGSRCSTTELRPLATDIR